LKFRWRSLRHGRVPGVIITAEFALAAVTTTQKTELIVMGIFPDSLFSLFNRFWLQSYLDTEY
jgi:hypothetical protein